MSKSLGNFRTVRELLEKFPGEVLRFALLSAHYRSPLNFSVELLEQSRAALDSLYGSLREAQDVEVDQHVVDVELRQLALHLVLEDLVDLALVLEGQHHVAEGREATVHHQVDVVTGHLEALGGGLELLGQGRGRVEGAGVHRNDLVLARAAVENANLELARANTNSAGTCHRSIQGQREAAVRGSSRDSSA